MTRANEGADRLGPRSRAPRGAEWARRTKSYVALALCLTFGSGCTAAYTTYTPKYVARGELTLRYNDGVEVWAGKKLLADAPAFGGLTHYVRCVDDAREHAEAAESDGSAAIGMGIAGTMIGVTALGALSGVYFVANEDTEDDVTGYAILGSGVVVGLLGMTLALISRSFKNSANGHAVDAMNYYNDSVGYYGGSCDSKPPPARVIVVPAAIPKPPEPPPIEPVPETPPDAEPSPDVPQPDAVPQPGPVPDNPLIPDQVAPDPRADPLAPRH
jgi:hypothetical protein